jgi:hypothetical protein
MQNVRSEANDAVHRCPNLVRHVSEELALAPVGQLGLLARNGVLLQRVAQVLDHAVDLTLERVHLSAGFDRDKGAEVAGGGRSRNLGERSDL